MVSDDHFLYIPLPLVEYYLHSNSTKTARIRLAVLRIYVALAEFQPYHDLEAGEIQVARQGIEPRASYSASQELNYSAIAAPSTERCGRTRGTTVAFL